MRNLFLLLLIANTTLFGQTEEFLVLTEYEYDLNYGISQFHRTAINQKTYDTTRVLLREVDYIKPHDKNKSDIGTVTYYFYENNNLKSVERYLPDATLIDASQFIYNKNNQLKEKKKFVLTNNKLTLVKNTKYKYKADSLVSGKTYNGDKKLIKKVLITREPGSRIIEKTFTDIATTTGQDSILSIRKIQTFNNQKLIEETEIYTRKDGTTETLKSSYEYDENNILSETVLYKNSQFINKKTYEHYSDNSVKSVTIFNEEKKKVDFRSWERSKVEIVYGGLESVF